MRGSSFGRDVFSFCCGFEAVVNININVIFSGYFRTDVLRKKVRVNKSSVHPCYVMKYEGKTKNNDVLVQRMAPKCSCRLQSAKNVCSLTLMLSQTPSAVYVNTIIVF